MGFFGANEITILQQDAEFNDAQIKALPTTGIDVVAALGENKVALAIASLWKSSIVAAYTNIDANQAALSLMWGAGLVPATAAVLDDATSGHVDLTLLLGTIGSFLAVCPAAGSFGENWGSLVGQTYNTGTVTAINAALKARLNNSGSGDLTGGHASNVLKVSVFYAIIDV